MKNFSPVERIKTTVKLQEPDVVPVALSFSASTTQALAQMSPEDFFSGPDKMLEAEVKVMRMFPEALVVHGLRPEYSPEFFATAYGYKYKWLSSGVSIDQSSMRVEDISVIDPYKDGLLPRMLEEWDYMIRHAPEDLQERWEDLLWSARMPSPIHLLADMLGFRRLFQLYYLDPKLVHELCEINCQSIIRWLDAQKALFRTYGIKLNSAFLFDETLGLTSPWIAKEYFLPYMKKITEQMSDFEIIRMHGDQDISHSWLPEVVKESGINVYNFNFTSLRRLKVTVGESICLEGNISSINLLLDGSKKEIEEAVQKLINTAGPGGGLIVATGGGVSSDVPPEKLRIMIEATEKYGRYPLEESSYENIAAFKTRYFERLPGKIADTKPLQEIERTGGDDAVAKVYDDVVTGNMKGIKSSVQETLDAGLGADVILREGLSRGLATLADKLYREQVFLPEMAFASEIFNMGIEVLEPHFKGTELKGKIVAGAIKGNVQESGIPIIGAFLRSSGWLVIDLGVDVSPEQFIDAAEKVSADIIAVGVYVRLGWEHALNLTKMIKERQLPFKTLAGGKGFKRAAEALEAGFDAFADDGFEAVKMADQLIAGKAGI